MRDRVAVAAGILALTLLSFFQFPGHMYLQSDTQIYAPMLEHMWDSSVLARDPVATRPHLAFTLYDEIMIALRWITRASFQSVLVAQQFVFRACEILGVYLLALSLPLTRTRAMIVAALFALGAFIAGPAVVSLEYEPVPRGFAVGLVLLASGLAAREHLMLADIAATLAFLYHPPTVFPFWLLYIGLTLQRRHYRDLWPLACGVVMLAVASRIQAGSAENQIFFARVDVGLERLQRMRAAYVWVSTWGPALIWQYLLLWSVSMAAYWRLRPKTGRLFLLGLPLIGLLSIPASYLLLEKLKWALIPQWQPARAALFVTVLAVILAAAAAMKAAERGAWIESALWFLVVFAVPMQAALLREWTLNRALLAIALAAMAAWAASRKARDWALGAVAIASFFLIPIVAHVTYLTHFETAAVDKLAQFAAEQTPKQAVFLFGDAGRALYPGIFRTRAERAVYVDWKSGGQINYSKAAADDWWGRWISVNALQFQPGEIEILPSLGIDYLVLTPANRLPGRHTAYEDSSYVVYELPKP